MQGSKPTIPRRDDRAEPDDDDDAGGSSRIDVVSVDSVRGADTATSGMVALRRELAKLNAQAAAVEKSLDDQRRERSESIERLEKERQHAIALETRVANAEGEVATLRRNHDLEIAELRAVHEKTLVELERARDERTAFEKAAEAATAAANEARAKAGKEETDAQAARDEAAKQASELAKANADLAREKEEHARDRATARERISVLEDAGEEASASAQQREAELVAAREAHALLGSEVGEIRKSMALLTTQLEEARQNEERLGRQLETALARAAEAESQALAISLTHASLEGSMRTLRDEITDASARVGNPAAAPASVSASRMLTITPDLAQAAVTD
jgi:chromosome segregation ATPase